GGPSGGGQQKGAPPPPPPPQEASRGPPRRRGTGSGVRILMDAFRRHGGRMAPLDRANVDTDQIIPKQFLKRIERSGFGPFLFYDWRRNDPDFVLNRPEYEGATVLIAGPNIGCGSSREHAPWSLQDAGFRA